VGVDYPLDVAPTDDPARDTRHALLSRAAEFKLRNVGISAGVLKLEVSIKNVGAGHNLPSGFAFARQMWVELAVEDGRGKPVFLSGVVGDASDDLCDAATLDEGNGPIRRHVVGCGRPDLQLVNFQRRLVDKATVAKDAQGNVSRNERGEAVGVAADDANESSIQRLAGGAVLRRRPSDEQLMNAIEPGQTRRFVYDVPLENPAGAVARARLLFSNLPPYFLRDLAGHQPPQELPRLEPLIKNLEIVQMAETRLAL
jgi:hypothetical protein